MKNRTYSVLSWSVSTVKKSQARMPAACDRRNSVQVGPAPRGGGGRGGAGGERPHRARQAEVLCLDAKRGPHPPRPRPPPPRKRARVERVESRPLPLPLQHLYL